MDYTYPFLFSHDSRNNSHTDNLYGPTVEDYLNNDSFPDNIDCPDYPKKMSFIVANHGTLGGMSQHELSNYSIRENLLLNILNSDLDIDIYGKGWSINDSRYKGAPPLKTTALKDYKYSICMENSSEDLYISEKLFTTSVAISILVFLSSSINGTRHSANLAKFHLVIAGWLKKA